MNGLHGQTAPVLYSFRTEHENVKPPTARDQLMKIWSVMKTAVCTVEYIISK